MYEEYPFWKCVQIFIQKSWADQRCCSCLWNSWTDEKRFLHILPHNFSPENSYFFSNTADILTGLNNNLAKRPRNVDLTMWKKQKFVFNWKIFRQINSERHLFAIMLFSRIFCEKPVKFHNFHTVDPCAVAWLNFRKSTQITMEVVGESDFVPTWRMDP